LSGAASSSKCLPHAGLPDFLLGRRGCPGLRRQSGGRLPPEDIVSATYVSLRASSAAASWCYTADFDEEYNEISRRPRAHPLFDDAACADPVFRGGPVEEIPVADPEHVHQP
jgi:hypothetical protein